MRVALVTTWDIPCGIAEHAAYLKAAVQAADPAIEIITLTDLHPSAIARGPVDGRPVDLVVLNYHAALHSQWTPDAIREVQQRGLPVVVIYHDSGVPNSDQCRQIAYVLRPRLDAMVVHEPFDDLPIEKVHYWRMGVPAWSGAWAFDQSPGSWAQGRPILGSIGFPFPWKNYDELARVTHAQGWALLLIAPGATPEQVQVWTALNPCLKVLTTFPQRAVAGAYLGGCDATAFCYTCANTGQSAAIYQGIAARKPLLAFRSCRQFRALYEDPLARQQITWCDSFAEVERLLRVLPIERVNPGMLALAEQESWRIRGYQYAGLFRSLHADRHL